MVEIEKCHCPSERELPEEFETHPTFIPSGILEGVKAILNMGAFFFGTHCTLIYFMFIHICI